MKHTLLLLCAALLAVNAFGGERRCEWRAYDLVLTDGETQIGPCDIISTAKCALDCEQQKGDDELVRESVCTATLPKPGQDPYSCTCRVVQLVLDEEQPQPVQPNPVTY